jgi:hypothetical protein
VNNKLASLREGTAVACRHYDDAGLRGRQDNQAATHGDRRRLRGETRSLDLSQRKQTPYDLFDSSSDTAVRVVCVRGGVCVCVCVCACERADV